MIDFTQIKKEYGGLVCRACLNAEHGAKLTPKDCIYYSKRKKCARCRVVKHVVQKLRFSGTLKTLFK